MNEQQRALAYSQAYDLFRRLYLQGLTADLLPFAGAIPALADAIPIPFDQDAAAAEHHHVFGFNVFAHESIFLDPDSMLGGPVTDDVQVIYDQVGFQPDAQGEAADHLGLELGLLARLGRAEAEAWQDGAADLAHQNRSRQRRFLDGHLLLWLPAVAQAVRQQGQPFYAALADLTLELAVDHRSDLEEDTPAEGLRFQLSAAPLLLDEETTGLREIASFLLTPAYSGLYLSRDDIGRLGAPHRLPRGFGERSNMLTNLLRSAAEYDSMPALLTQLQHMASDWEAAYARLPDSMVTIASVWLERIAATQRLLDRLQAAIVTS